MSANVLALLLGTVLVLGLVVLPWLRRRAYRVSRRDRRA